MQKSLIIIGYGQVHPWLLINTGGLTETDEMTKSRIDEEKARKNKQEADISMGELNQGNSSQLQQKYKPWTLLIIVTWLLLHGYTGRNGHTQIFIQIIKQALQNSCDLLRQIKKGHTSS